MKRKCVHLKKYLICLVLLVLVFPSCDGGRDKDQKFKILTGPRDGIYYEFMKGLIKRLEDMPYEPIDTSNNNVVLYNTPGSVYNLERLSQGQANFAIAQADVISETAARRGYDIYGVAPLFREYIFIFRLLPGSETPRVKEFDPLKVKHIYIPGEGAGTYLTAKRFLDLAEVDPGKIVNDGLRASLSKIVKEARKGEFDCFLFAVLNQHHPLIRDISDGRLDGWDTGTNPPTPAWRTNGKRNHMWDLYDSLNLISDGENKTPGYPVELVSLPGETRKSMKDLYGIYENTPIPIKDIGGPGDFTLFMRAFLVVRSDEKEENVEVLLDYFYKDKKFRETIAGAESTDSIGRIGGVPIEKPAQIKWPMPIHMGAYKTLSREEVIEDTKPGRSWAFIYWVLFLLILVFWVILVFMEKMIEGIQKGTSTTRKKSLHLMYKRRNIIAAISVVLLVVIFICSPCFINDIEVSASRVYGYESPFNNMEIPEVSGWLLIFTISGTEQGIFPSNPYSKTILFLLNIVLKVMTPLIIAFYAAQWVRNLIKKPGLQKKGFSKHVVFIGWNKAYSSLIKKVVEVNETFKFVIITPDITNPNPLEDSDLPANKVGLVQGSPLDMETLKKACIDQAQCIYLVSSSCQKNNYLTWLPVSFDNFMTRLYNEKKLGSIPPIYIL
ncbi:MAG: hypothetical protein JSV88_18310, partial [Candidatus Aminicenantes bacterium]